MRTVQSAKPRHSIFVWIVVALVGIVLMAVAGRVNAQRYQAQAVSPAYLHAGPIVRFPVVAVVPAGSWVRLDGCLPDWSWCQVGWGTAVGWAQAMQVGVDAQGWVRTTRGVYWFNGPPIVPFYAQRFHPGTQSSVISQPHSFEWKPVSPSWKEHDIDRTPRPMLDFPQR